MDCQVFAILVLSTVGFCCSEIIVNGDFESELDGTNWVCFSCTLERDEDAFGGIYSGKISNRTENWAGITQYISPEAGGSYKFSAKFKLLNQDSDKLWHQVEILIHEVYPSGEEVYSLIGENPHVQQDDGWIEIGGDFEFSTSAYESVRVYLQIPEANINYLIDDATMTLIEENDAWEEEANIRINEIRKSDVTFNLQMNDTIDPDGVMLQFEMLKHAFPFGTAMQANLVSDTSGIYQAYQDFFFNNFNYAVLENALKWKQMEPNQDEIDYATPEAAIDIFQENNIPVRGHSVTWGRPFFVPEWLYGLTPEQVEIEISDRITGVVSYFQDRLIHWDVDNENLHGGWNEWATGRHDILAQMFTEINQVDPNVALFINDYNVVNLNVMNMAMKMLALKLIEAGAPIYGIGIQSHIDYVGPSIHVMKSRLDVVAEAGLPIWITELDVRDDDVNIRADRYEDILRLYFSHEAIEGILLWGFWDQAHWRPECALAEGPDVTPNAAGLRWQQLLFEEWTTNVTLTPSSLNTRAFHGDYLLTVSYFGEVIQEQDLTVVNGNNVFDVSIQ